MKFFHLSDLHLGLRLAECSLLEDQAWILERILDLALQHKPDGVLIAGDIYDRAVPPAEAVALFDDFLSRLAGMGIKVFVTSGNHDSPERIAFGGQLTRGSGVYFSPVYDGKPLSVTLEDRHGPLTVHMLPFVKPAHLRRFHPDTPPENYTEALRLAIGDLEGFDPARRNLIMAHQFFAGASRTDSEEVSVGGLDSADWQVLADFDYAALGHIHRPQWVGRQTIRYCGTPLPYSFSEAEDQKSLTLVEFGPKGQVEISTLPLAPLRGMRVETGSYDQLMHRALNEGRQREDYIAAVLTDQEDVPEAMARLRTAWPNLLRLSYDNARSRAGTQALEGAAGTPEDRTPLDLFEELYQKQNGLPLSPEQTEYLTGLIGRVWEVEP